MSDGTELRRSDFTEPGPASDPLATVVEEPLHEEHPAPLPQDPGLATVAGGPPAGRASLWADAWGELRRSPLFIGASVIVIVAIAMAAFPTLFTQVDPRACDLANSLLLPRPGAPFGNDLQGCDYLARTVHGARASIAIGFLAAGTAAIIGAVLGSLTGYHGGWLDAVLNRIADIFFAIPTILGGLVILSAIRTRAPWTVALVLVVLSWPTLMRLMRSQVLSVKEQDYVQAARALGGGDMRILTRHILPNAVAPVVVYATILVGVVIGAEATLSFLGIGLQLPAISWGLMLSEAQSRILTAPHLLLFPGLFLSVTVLAFLILGDALRDALDPRLR